MSPSLLAALAFCLLNPLVKSQPVVTFPFNSQLPLVARTDSFFSYSFSPATFASTSKIVYSLGRHPEWLSLESEGRRLYGTPKDSDVAPGDVGQTVDIVATDATGSTTTRATLVVSRKPSPSLRIPLADQMQRFGNLSAPSSILSYPSTSFKYTFDPATFGQSGLNYYAASGDGSPLPAWIKFDTASLTFSGKTPPFESLVQSPQRFDFNLVASDVVGFSATSLAFSIVVGSHKLIADKPIVSLNASQGTELTYDGLAKGIRLDGRQALPRDVTATTADLPTWLSYDPTTRRLSGTPGPTVRSTNFTISFHDSFSDVLDVLFLLHVDSGLFASTLDDLALRPGMEFELDLTQRFRVPADINLTLSTEPNQEWLHADAFKLSGTVPVSTRGSSKVTLTAVSRKSGVKETEVFLISFLTLDGTATSPTAMLPTTSMVAAATSASAASAAGGTDHHPGRLSTGQILLATILPILSLTILLILFTCFVRHRRAKRTYLSTRYRARMLRRTSGALCADYSEASLHRGDSFENTAAQNEKHAIKSDKVGYASIISRPLKRESSRILPSAPSHRQASDAGPDHSIQAASAEMARTAGRARNECRQQSWVTMEGDTATSAARSERSVRSHRSDTTCPESTFQMLPTPRFLHESRNGEFRSSLDTMLPNLDSIPSGQYGFDSDGCALQRSATQNSLGARSAKTSSSSALPPVFENRLHANTMRTESVVNWERLADSEAGESLSEVRRPSRALLSLRTDDSKQWFDAESLKETRSVWTDMSFGSSENWRVIGSRGGGPPVDLTSESPMPPSRPSTARGGAASSHGRGSIDALSPSKWGADTQSTVTRVRPAVARDAEVGEKGGGGEQPESRKAASLSLNASDGSGSYRVFL